MIRPVAVPLPPVPYELIALHGWLVDAERQFEKDHPRSVPVEPIRGLSSALINQYLSCHARIREALKANDQLEEGAK